MHTYELRGVDRRFRTEEGADVAALSAVDLTIGQGERIALIGPSGAGKTTLIRILNGLTSPSKGDLRFAGQPLDGQSASKMRTIRARIGTVHQADCLVGQLPVYQNVLAGGCGRQNALQILRTRIWPLTAEIAASRRCLERVGLEDKWQEPTFALSGGQRQRVAIARVLYQDPAVILADEPVSSLDPALAREVVDLLVGLLGDRTLVVSLHAVDLALTCFERVVALKEGRVFFDLPAARVSESLLAQLFSSSPTSSTRSREVGHGQPAPAWKPVL